MRSSRLSTRVPPPVCSEGFPRITSASADGRIAWLGGCAGNAAPLPRVARSHPAPVSRSSPEGSFRSKAMLRTVAPASPAIHTWSSGAKWTHPSRRASQSELSSGSGSAAKTPSRYRASGGRNGPSHRANCGRQMRSAVGEVAYTRSDAAATAVMCEKSPITTRSSSDQSRVGSCAAIAAGVTSMAQENSDRLRCAAVVIWYS